MSKRGCGMGRGWFISGYLLLVASIACVVMGALVGAFNGGNVGLVILGIIEATWAGCMAGKITATLWEEGWWA